MKKFDLIVIIIRNGPIEIDDIVLIATDEMSFGFDFEEIDEDIFVVRTDGNVFKKVTFEEEFNRIKDNKIVIYKFYLRKDNIVELFKLYDILNKNKDKIIKDSSIVRDKKVIEMISELKRLYPENFI